MFAHACVPVAFFIFLQTGPNTSVDGCETMTPKIDRCFTPAVYTCRGLVDQILSLVWFWIKAAVRTILWQNTIVPRVSSFFQRNPAGLCVAASSLFINHAQELRALFKMHIGLNKPKNNDKYVRANDCGCILSSTIFFALAYLQQNKCFFFCGV